MHSQFLYSESLKDFDKEKLNNQRLSKLLSVGLTKYPEGFSSSGSYSINRVETYRGVSIFVRSCKLRTQTQFPRTKKRRIQEKWSKNPRYSERLSVWDWKSGSVVICDPAALKAFKAQMDLDLDGGPNA